MPEAEPDDVRLDIDTQLDDPEITSLIERVSREIDREYEDDPSVTFDDAQHRSDFEAVLTAHRIAGGRDRRSESVATGRSQVTYETSEINSLRERVRRLDPGDVFGYPGNIIRDSGRTIATGDDS